MSRRTATSGAGAPSGSSATTIKRTRALLACGVVAGPLFLAVAVLQALTRDGFDLSPPAAVPPRGDASAPPRRAPSPAPPRPLGSE
jgi:hypothetical protein